MPELGRPPGVCCGFGSLVGAGLCGDGQCLVMTSVHPSGMPHPVGWGEGRCCWTRRPIIVPLPLPTGCAPLPS